MYMLLAIKLLEVQVSVLHAMLLKKLDANLYQIYCKTYLELLLRYSSIAANLFAFRFQSMKQVLYLHLKFWNKYFLDLFFHLPI